MNFSHQTRNRRGAEQPDSFRWNHSAPRRIFGELHRREPVGEPPLNHDA